MGTKAMTWPVLLALVGALSACVSSEQGTSNSKIRSGARWVQDLNEPPPIREPASDAARLRDELRAARR